MPVICPVTGTGVYLLAMTAEITEGPVQPVQEAGPAEDAPYGWMTDPDTGQRRPKKRPGRRSKTAAPPVGPSPSIEQLQELGRLPEASEDTAPGAPPKGRRKKTRAAEPLPPFRAGVIAKGVNRLYRRAGQIARMFHPDIGTAIIATTRARPKDDDDDEEQDLTVGEAWENVARHNPRIRAFLLKFITGGDYGALFWSHLPIFMAIAMTDAIRRRLPLVDLAAAFLTDEDESGEPVPSGLAQMMGGINPDDMAQMMAMAQGLMGQVAADMPRAANMPRGPVNGAQWPQDAPREHAEAAE